MNKDACFELGYITKLHGLKGEVSVFLDTDNPENYLELESVFVEINQKLVPFFIQAITINGEKAVVKFEEVDSPEEAEELKGLALFLPLSVLPPLKGNKFYYHEVIGFEVYENDSNSIGTIVQILDASAQHLFVIDHKGKEVLIPINDDILKSIDRYNKRINVTLPEGLLDIYLNDEN